MEPKTMHINEVEYVRKDSVKETIVKFTGEESVASRAVEKKVIVRTRNEGLN